MIFLLGTHHAYLCSWYLYCPPPSRQYSSMIKKYSSSSQALLIRRCGMDWSILLNLQHVYIITSFSTIFFMIWSPGTLFGQYRNFLTRVPAYTPFTSSATAPFATQKPLYTTTYFIVEKRGSHIQSMIPSVIPSSKCSFGTSCSGLSFPSTICNLYKIRVNLHQIVINRLWCYNC